MSYIVEVHSVAITLHEYDNIERPEIYGVIQALYNENTIEIYKETKESCKPLLADGTLYLTGPSVPINAPAFGFQAHLKDKHTDLEVSNGFFYMHQHPPSEWYSRPMSIVFEGKHGVAILYATMYSNAVAISVGVRLNTEGPKSKKEKITDGGDDSKSLRAIYGTLHVRRIGEKVLYRRTLFSRCAEDPQGLDRDVIPLSRCLIVLPYYASFVIEADLWEKTDDSGTPVQVVKNGFLFKDTPKHLYGPKLPEIQNLKGLEVKVTLH